MQVAQQKDLDFDSYKTILNDKGLTKEQIISLLKSEAEDEKAELQKDVSKHFTLPSN